MSELPGEVLTTLSWVAVATHLIVGVVVLRRPAGMTGQSLLAAVNLSVALCVLGYWANAWYGYVARGITWYASDQLIPLYAALVALVSVLVLAGRYDTRLAHGIQWVAFVVDALVLTAAALYFSFVRFDRLF